MARSKRSFDAFGYKFHSKLELSVATDLHNRNEEFKYETESFKWIERLPRAFCGECGEKSALVERSYTPDFFLPSGIIVEVKGNFTSKDRKIALAMKEQHPELDVRMLFQRDNWLTRQHKTKYSDWCEARGIEYAFIKIPDEWL